MTTSYSTLYKSLIQVSKKSHLNKGTWALIASALACVPAVAAETELATQDNMPVAYFPKITVTATRTPTAVNNTIAQTRVIDSEELKRYQGQTVLDVIKNQAGINVINSGGMGSTSNFYMRGFDSKQVLVLIDGVRYGSISTGQPSVSLLPADQIDRIEVVYGASGSSIYGADAMGGIIQIFTKDGSDITGATGSITAGIGSNSHYNLGATAQYGNDTSSLSLGVSRTETDGFNAIKNTNSYDFYPDNDGFESTNASLAIKHNISSDLSAGITALYSDSTTDIDSAGNAFPNAYADQKNGSVNGHLNYQTELTSTTLSYGQTFDKTTTHDSNSIDYKLGSKFDTTQKQARLETRVNAQPGTAIVGVEWLSQELDASDVLDFSNYPQPPMVTPYKPSDRKVKSAFMGYQLTDAYYDLQANYRIDDYSKYGNKHTYNLGFAIKPAKGFRVGANHATGFRAPTFNDLYWPGASSPDLRPETTETTELFFEFTNNLQATRLTGYYTDAEDLITGGRNIGKAKIKGVSLTSDWIYDSFLFGLGYDYLKAEDDTKGSNTYGNQLDHRPENSALLYVGYQQPSFDVRLEAKYNDERNSDGAKVKLDDYTLLNLAGNYHFTPNLSAGLRVDNITDEDYTLSNQFGNEYATDGTNYFGSLTYTWK